MTTYTRADWGARAGRGGPGNLDPEKVIGVALHWPAMTKPLRDVDAVKGGLRSWQDYHMDSHGWSDIAYQLAFDQAGNTYTLRGLRAQSGANGDQAVNETYGAFLLVLAPGEEPSRELIAAVQAAVAEHRRLFPRSHKIVGHGQIRPEPTSCPGPDIQEAINDGVFEPPTNPSRVERARRRLRQAARLLEDTPAHREVAHAQARAVRDVLAALPDK